MDLALWDQIYIALSIFSAFSFLASFFISLDAMRKGLTYECLVATLWGLGFMSAGRLWHSIYGALDLEFVYGKMPETLEYVIYLIGFLSFARLVWKGYRIRAPHRAFKKK